MKKQEILKQSQYNFIRENPRLGRHIMLLCLSGSHGYGTAVAGSDIDLRGITLNTSSDLLGLTSFEQYADAQLRRLENALARDRYPQAEKEKHILNSVKNSLSDFNRRYQSFDNGSIQLYLDTSERSGWVTEIYVDANYRHYPLRDYENMWSILNHVVRDYEKIGKRNHKKDRAHLNKHAMHLIRLFMMAIDILEKEQIITYRAAEQELLMKIRTGGFQQEDGNLNREFYDLLGDYESRLASAAARTRLPEQPDLERVGEFMEYVNGRVVQGDF